MNMKLAYTIGIVTVLLNQAFGTYFKKSSEIKEESLSTKPLQRHKLDENLIQTNKSDCELNGSETRHLVIVKLPKGKDNKYIDNLNDRIVPIFPKDISNSNAEDIFDGATDKRCAEDVIKNSDPILALRGKPVSLPKSNPEAFNEASLTKQFDRDSYNKATTQYAHVFKRPGSYNDRPTLFNRSKLIVKLDPPKKPPKKVSEIYQSLGIYQRRKPTTGLYEKPLSPFGVGYKDRRKSYEKPPGILVTDYRRPIIFNRERHAVDPLKVIPNKDVGFESNPGYYPSNPFNDRFLSARIFGKANKQYNFPKVSITPKTVENIFEPKLESKKKYITPIIGRNGGINKGLLILKSIFNKTKAVSIDENIDVTQTPVSYGRNKEQNKDNKGSKRIDLLWTNNSEEVLFADPVLGSKNSSSKVIGLDNKESDLFEGTNNDESDQVNEINDIGTNLIEGMNDKENNLVEGTNDKECDLNERMNDKKSDLVDRANAKESNLVDGANEKESDLVDGAKDKESDVVEDTNDKESDLVDGANEKESDLVDGANNKESNLVDGAKDKESDVLEETNDKGSDLVDGAKDKVSNLVDGANDKESDLVEGTIGKESNQDIEINDKKSEVVEETNDKESNLFPQINTDDVLSKNRVNEETLLNNSLNLTCSEQSIIIEKNENKKEFIPPAEILTSIMNSEIKPNAAIEINSLNSEGTTASNFIDENFNAKRNGGKLFENFRNSTSLSRNNKNDNRPIITVMINTRNFSKKEDKNKNVSSRNESMNQMSNISPPDFSTTDTNKSNEVSDLLINDSKYVVTTPMTFLEIAIPKAIHESLLKEHNSIRTTDSKNSAGSNTSDICSEECNYESKETNARNKESRSDYLSYNTTINKDDPLPDIFNYSRGLPKVVLAPEIIDHPPHELVEGQFVKLQHELFGRSDSESYSKKDLLKNSKNGQLSEVYDDKLDIPEKDKREYIFEEPLQHYTTENAFNLASDNFSPKNELSYNINNEHTYFPYEDDFGRSRPPDLSLTMEDLPSFHKSKSVDNSLIFHGSNIDGDTFGALDFTKGYPTRKSENTNLYEVSGTGSYFGNSHLDSDTVTVNEFKRRGSHDLFPSYEYIGLNNPDSQLENIERKDNWIDTTNSEDIARENKEDLGNQTVAPTIEDANLSNDFDKTMEVRKMPSINKYLKDDLDLKRENDHIETIDSYASENPHSYKESEKHLINRMFDYIKPKNDNNSEYIGNIDEYNIHNIPKLINNYIYPETTGSRTDTGEVPLNTENFKCLSCDYEILSKSKLAKESDEIMNDNTNQSSKQICIHVDDKGDIKDDMMNLLYQVLTNKTASINNTFADGKKSDNSGKNEGKEKISANIFNLLVRHLNNASARKQLQENYQNLLTKSKTEIDDDAPAILDLSDQSSERKETYNQRFFKIPNNVQLPDGPFTDVNESESKEFAKGVGTMISSNESNDSQELLSAISKVMRKVQQRSRPTYRNNKMCGKKKCNDFIGRRTELMKNIIGSLHEYVIEDKTTT